MKSSNSNLVSINQGVTIRARKILEYARKHKIKYADATERLYPDLNNEERSKVLDTAIQLFCLSKIMKR